MPSGRLDDGGGGGTVVPDGATFEEAVWNREAGQIGEEQLDYDEFFSTTPEPEGGGADFEIGGETYGSADEFWRDVQNDDGLVTGGDPWQPVRDGAESVTTTVETNFPGLDWLPWAVGGTLGTVVLLVVVFIVGQLFTVNVGGDS